MPQKTIQSLIRGLEILEFVAGSEDGLTLPELAGRMGVTTTTAFNLGTTLVLKGYLEKTARPVRYRLGPAAVRLGEAREGRLWVRRTEAGLLALAQELPDATLVLGEMLGGDVVVSLRVDSERPTVLERYSNRLMPPYTSATVLCFQAFGPSPEAQAYRRRHPFSEFGTAMWAEEAALDTFLREIRSRGYVVVSSHPPFRVAAPIYGPGNQLIACLGGSLPTSGDSGQQSRDRLVGRTVSEAIRLSRPVAADGDLPPLRSALATGRLCYSYDDV
ncbi:MAG: helix-turn-helix domain-containing protein [Lentisphaerae bacterium]|nr:helix-turn-helix domain-containing protein [Lentisphaerota bacterium]MBT4817286.1 helix-turn-helix domain-containing protein [Lentisphaerota bacterium]MBT5607719.1 helix-turn-helix domain-containing protein [Lentisphaerota bacterium]MBT7054882.1 helix-turn-helix domain-containing protein [Lentisphaerota bacterium]MBT7843348.1 helix-turn-helix domain-containing protein [Lentisphaerota bacterium]